MWPNPEEKLVNKNRSRNVKDDEISTLGYQNNSNNMFSNLQDIMNIKVKESKGNSRKKNAICEMKNLLNEINLKLETAE